MNKGLVTFFRVAGTLSVVTVIVYLLFLGFGVNYYPDFFLVIPVYFVLVAALLAYLVNKAEKNRNFLSLTVMLGFRFLIVFVALLILFVGMFFDRQHVLSYAGIFVLYYILFSVFETRTLVKLNKKNDTK